MTLRLRTLLSMLMPDLVCREVTATESAEAYVCTETLQAVMADFLDAGMAVRRVRPVVPDLPESVQGTAAETEAKVPDPPEAEEQVDEDGSTWTWIGDPTLTRILTLILTRMRRRPCRGMTVWTYWIFRTARTLP